MEKGKDLKTEIYTEFYPKVYGYILKQVNNSDTAEDIASDVFLNVYNKIDSFDDKKASLSTWIFTITHNTLVDYYRTRKQVVDLDEAFDNYVSEEDDLYNDDMLETLANGLEKLKEKERNIIIKRYYENKKLKDVAEELKISYVYAKILHTKALLNLKKMFK